MISYKHPKLYRHMGKLGVSIFAFTTSWFLCLFMQNPLPYNTTLQFWDYLFCYGDEMLFLMALEILLHRSEDLLAITNGDELLSFTLHSFQKELDKTSFTRIVQKIGSLEYEISVLRTYFRKSETIKAAENRFDCSTLANKYGFTGAQEVQHLWKLFVSPEPWEVLLTEVSWFALAFHKACYPKEPDSFCAHGLMSGFLHRLFDTLDVHKTGDVTFKRFLKAVHTLRYGSKEERTKLCFRFYDFDGDGKINFDDVKLGIDIISNMIEGCRSDEEKKGRMQLCRDLINKGWLFTKEREIIIEKVFDSGPFGLQLKTNTISAYPLVKKILIESSVEKGIQIGWQLVRINEISFKHCNDSMIYDAMKAVKFPAQAIFRQVVYPKIDESDEAVRTRKLDFTQFSRVIQMHAKTSAIFRLHGAILQHWRPAMPPSSVRSSRSSSQADREQPQATPSRMRRFSIRNWFGSGKKAKPTGPVT